MSYLTQNTYCWRSPRSLVTDCSWARNFFKDLGRTWEALSRLYQPFLFVEAYHTHLDHFRYGSNSQCWCYQQSTWSLEKRSFLGLALFYHYPLSKTHWIENLELWLTSEDRKWFWRYLYPFDSNGCSPSKFMFKAVTCIYSFCSIFGNTDCGCTILGSYILFSYKSHLFWNRFTVFSKMIVLGSFRKEWIQKSEPYHHKAI